MADIRKRKGPKGDSYQVRYPSKAAKTGYAALIGSLWPVLRDNPVLQQRSIYQAFMFGSITLFFTCIPVLLQQHAHGHSTQMRSQNRPAESDDAGFQNHENDDLAACPHQRREGQHR